MDAPGEPFLMHVEDVFRRNQGGVVVLTGRIERGRVRRGDEVEIVGLGGNAVATVGGNAVATVGDIEACRRYVGEARAGMNVGVSIRGMAGGAVERGQVLAAPGSMSAHTSFAAAVSLLSEEHGGAGVRTGERLHFHIRTAAVTGEVTLARDLDVLRPLHAADVTIRLERPVALEDGQSFAFRHLGRAAGSGVVTRLLDRAWSAEPPDPC